MVRTRLHKALDRDRPSPVPCPGRYATTDQEVTPVANTLSTMPSTTLSTTLSTTRGTRLSSARPQAAAASTFGTFGTAHTAMATAMTADVFGVAFAGKPAARIDDVQGNRPRGPAPV